ncbi:hypothetical protein [Polyangium sorediatum]|uniref:Uncharacterized protein n=1 Tax=Polyangium sorediatum TaxID=889274 RepID=A0ABT6NHY2_9BACT|nr:hypothetical protein [Polyangium sorediatum]MDI1427914.1 hypothetical protein [Polyangium sorediatum]
MSAGGGARIGARYEGGGFWFFGSYHRTVSPATLYGLPIEGAHVAVGGDLVLAGFPLGVVVGFSLSGAAFFNDRPGAPWNHGGNNWFHARLGLDKVFRLGGRFWIRTAVTAQIPDSVHTLIVNQREDQRWSSTPISGVLSVEVLADLTTIKKIADDGSVQE